MTGANAKTVAAIADSGNVFEFNGALYRVLRNNRYRDRYRLEKFMTRRHGLLWLRKPGWKYVRPSLGDRSGYYSQREISIALAPVYDIDDWCVIDPREAR